jgi:hypothetical protein
VISGRSQHCHCHRQHLSRDKGEGTGETYKCCLDSGDGRERDMPVEGKVGLIVCGTREQKSQFRSHINRKAQRYTHRSQRRWPLSDWCSP